MAILPIYNCFHPILKKKTKAVEVFDENLKKLVDDMFETMDATGNGVGLAGNQVGVEQSVIVIDVNYDEKKPKVEPLVMINPTITAFSEETMEDKEGCLSVPDLYEAVIRSREVDVTYFDVDGKEHKKTYEGFVARVIQHEVDHLNGILFYEKISPLRRTLAKGKLRKIEKGIILGDYAMIMPNGELV